MSNQPAFDVVTQNQNGQEIKLGRTWLHNKEGKYSFSFDLSSLPLGGATVQLVSQDSWDQGDCPTEFFLKMPVDKGENKKTYWHPVGLVRARPGDAKHPFDVLFDTIPLIGNLCAFPARPAKANEDDIPFG
jgi:hypothetical protein